VITHIVFFKFKEENKTQNIKKTKQLLEDLKNKIDTIKQYEIGINFDKADRAMDLSLFSRFDTVSDLNNYATNPEHLKVVEFIKTVTQYTKVVDYQS
jgi:hypothetical protein